MDVTAPGRLLHSRFVSLGDMTGKTSAEIIAAVGHPNSISDMAGGLRLLQWQATGCHMAILFGADDCMVKITHQHMSFHQVPYYRASPVRDDRRESGGAGGIGVVLGILVGLALLIWIVST